MPSAGFLNENKPLPPNVELKLSFDRLAAEYSTLLVDQESNSDPLKGTVLELKNVFAQVEYVSSPQMRSYFDRISETPIPYIYDECAVLFKSLPQNEQSIRLDNLKGGNTPDYLFMAICRTEALYGSSKFSAVNFKYNNVKDINYAITISISTIDSKIITTFKDKIYS